ncbi:hypothetical protein [Algoriphagus pacificus]|uniref:Trypsin-like peptidase domain-containing protein n=1 Tax=Algoriphagus pacificus TaxID=2811234 RepID=A0ABS3CA90_9BACT|nr:hypothetical protein [Algoriphagus pacificus]MBN7814028.1 hypothetical protein [Algoriphagus pacificus]
MYQEEKWKELCNDTLVRMKDHVEPFITPIWKYNDVDEKDIKLHGSGSYFENPYGQFIITNEHVAKYNQGFRLTHSFKGSQDILNIRNPFLSELPPIDTAISRIDNDIWLDHKCEGEAIPLKRFATKHSPVENELLFFAGFSGERSRVLFENCFSRGTPFLTQECPFPVSIEKQADQTYHMSIPYPPELAETSDSSEPLPDPHGFSGSLLWNTKRIECKKKEIEWSPSMAEVTAIIWGWPSSSVCILATKIEHINLEEMTREYQKL